VRDGLSSPNRRVEEEFDVVVESTTPVDVYDVDNTTSKGIANA